MVAGPPTTFGIDNLSTQFPGSAQHCGDDLYFAGKNGSNATRLIAVNGLSYAVQTNTFGLPSTQPSIFKTAGGIEMIGSPLPTTSAEKAVFKVSCSPSTGIMSYNQNVSSLNLFPNPSNGDLYIQSNINYNKIEVFSLQGHLVFSLKSGTSKIDVSNFENGFYFIVLSNEIGQTITQRFVKMN